MIAYEKWMTFKEEMERAIDEGVECGFDKEEDTFQAGCYFAYTNVMKLIKLLDDYDVEEHYYD